ncbi:MAG: universal stress protein, partial [Halobacteriales archaeon]
RGQTGVALRLNQLLLHHLRTITQNMQFAVATDGSTQSVTALDHAIDIAAGLDASLIAIHAVDPSIYEERRSEPIADLPDAEQRLVIEDIEDAEQRGRQILDEAVTRADERGFEIRTELLYGRPVETIASYVEEHDFDGLFVGHRDLSKDPALGSVAKGLIDQASVPVTVVR